MDARQLHADFAQRGFVLHARDGRIKVRPASRLSEADREAIQVHREELLDLLVGVEALELVRRVDPDAMLITVRPVANTGRCRRSTGALRSSCTRAASRSRRCWPKAAWATAYSMHYAAAELEPLRISEVWWPHVKQDSTVSTWMAEIDQEDAVTVRSTEEFRAGAALDAHRHGATKKGKPNESHTTAVPDGANDAAGPRAGHGGA